MQKVTVPYYKSSLDFELADDLEIVQLHINDCEPIADFDAAVDEALAHPIASAPIPELVKPGQTAAVIISDMTRASYRTDLYLCKILNQLNAGGIPDENITVVIACGYHAPATPEEEKILAGEEACRRVKIESHNCRADDLVSYGKTVRGNNVYINHTVATADHVVLTGGICYHTFAGFGGGRKSIAPGVAGAETIEGNHRNCFSRETRYEIYPKATSGYLEGNPVSEEMFEIAEMVKPSFLVNVIVDDHGQMVGLVAGDWKEAYYAGVEKIRKIYGVPMHETFDAAIISNGGYPKDINLFQSVKGLHNACFVMNPGSSVVLCADCFDGFGPEGYRKGFTDFDGYKALWDAQNEHYDPEMAISLLTMRYLQKIHKVYLISSLPDEEVRMAGMIPVKTPEEGWARVLEDKPDLKKVMVLPCGALTCPILE